jgi:hypothetical protein
MAKILEPELGTNMGINEKERFKATSKEDYVNLQN